MEKVSAGMRSKARVQALSNCIRGQYLIVAHVAPLMHMEVILYPFVLNLEMGSCNQSAWSSALHLQSTLKFHISVPGKTASCQLYNLSKTQWLFSAACLWFLSNSGGQALHLLLEENAAEVKWDQVKVGSYCAAHVRKLRGLSFWRTEALNDYLLSQYFLHEASLLHLGILRFLLVLFLLKYYSAMLRNEGMWIRHSYHAESHEKQLHASHHWKRLLQPSSSKTIFFLVHLYHCGSTVQCSPVKFAFLFIAWIIHGCSPHLQEIGNKPAFSGYAGPYLL